MPTRPTPPTSMEDPNAEYASFLRSGAYPVTGSGNGLPRTFLGRQAQLVARMGGLATLALLAGGSGYLMTEWLVPTGGAQGGANHGADASHMLASIARPSSPSDIQADLEASGRDMPSALSGDQSFGNRRAFGRSEAGRDAQHLAAIVGSARRFKRRSNDVAEVSVGASPSAESLPVSGSPGELDLLSAENLRTQLIADRVRALDEAHSQMLDENRPVSAGPGEGPLVEPTDSPISPTSVERAGRFAQSSRFTHAAAIVKPNPQPARFPGLQLRAAANIEDLNVRGSLSASNVRRGIERLKPALATCYEHAAQHAGRNSFGRVELSLTIDEAGRVRAPQVQGAELPGLSTCLNSVTSKLVSQPPDTGTVRASIVVNFVP